jgi:superfamily I DNA/RNA helicase
VWNFRSQEDEAIGIARFIAAEATVHGLRPRDFVLLVRQRASDYIGLLEPALASEGIVLRNEAGEIGPVRLQELLAEELSDLVVRVLRVATADRAGRAWVELLAILANLRGIAAEHGEYADLSRETVRFTSALRRQFPEPPQDATTATTLVGRILDFINRSVVAAAFPAYRQGDWMQKVIEAVIAHLRNSSKGHDVWLSALDAYDGTHSLPLMTIHKSKGLEYHTVVFLGLDDGAWWSYAQDQAEATAGFFVAFTRAKQRVLFTYCPARGGRKKIAPLYELLERAGVKTATK